MKRYAGDYMTAYCGFVLLVFTLGPIVFSCYLLLPNIGYAQILFSFLCVVNSGLCAYWMISRSETMYCWYVFNEEGIVVKNIFKRTYLVSYSEFANVGIGYYIHGVMNSDIGSKMYYIFFSKQMIDDQYKSQINLVKPSKTFLKIGFNQKTYQYLVEHLSNSHVKLLSMDAKRLGLT